MIIAVNFPNFPLLPMCGFIAQLVEYRTGIVEIMGSNPVETLIFSGSFFPVVKFTAMIILHIGHILLCVVEFSIYFTGTLYINYAYSSLHSFKIVFISPNKFFKFSSICNLVHRTSMTFNTELKET